MPTTRIPYGVLDGRYVNAAGDTMLGELTLPGAPTLDLHAATKKYVDDAVGVGGHTHTLSAGATDVTATAAEVNLLDLSGLSIGQVLRATGAASAAWGGIQAGDLPTGIDAAKVSDGSVSNTEYQYLNGVTSAIQTQLDAKAADSIVLKKDGSVALTTDWDIGDGRMIKADKIQARDAAGLALYEDGGKGVFIKDGGYVGINTADPLVQLHVAGPTLVENANIFTTTGYGFSFGNGEQAVLGQNNVGLRFLANSVDVMRVDHSGKVGIGTSGPDRKLEVLDASNPQLRLTHTDGSVYTDFQTVSDGYLHINPSGNRVGIGTSSPSQALEVAGSIIVGAHDTYHKLYINRYSSGGYAYIVAGDTDRDMGVGFAFQYRNDNGSLVTGLSIDVNGKAGIGITPSARRLEILDSSASQFRLTQLANTNYVDFLANASGDLTITPSGSKVLMAKALEVDGAFDHDGSTFGVFGVTPASRVPAYTVTNAITDRSFDADNTTIAELADVVATIINDLKTYGFFQ